MKQFAETVWNYLVALKVGLCHCTGIKRVQGTLSGLVLACPEMIVLLSSGFAPGDDASLRCTPFKFWSPLPESTILRNTRHTNFWWAQWSKRTRTTHILYGDPHPLLRRRLWIHGVHSFAAEPFPGMTHNKNGDNVAANWLTNMVEYSSFLHSQSAYNLGLVGALKFVCCKTSYIIGSISANRQSQWCLYCVLLASCCSVQLLTCWCFVISHDLCYLTCSASIAGNSFSEWSATISGPEGSPYEGGIFHLKVVFPMDYPFSPPKVGRNSDIPT